MIKVLFFAQLREQLKCSEITVSANDVESVLQLRDYLILKNPSWVEFLANPTLLIAVNQTLVKSSHVVISGDEVAFFPPVTGG